jgi:hypothetical protein
MKNLHIELPKPIKLLKKNLIGSCLFFLMIWTFNSTQKLQELQKLQEAIKQIPDLKSKFLFFLLLPIYEDSAFYIFFILAQIHLLAANFQ